jgi:hypothetical protein
MLALVSGSIGWARGGLIAHPATSSKITIVRGMRTLRVATSVLTAQ